jgi:hypothetical protein
MIMERGVPSPQMEQMIKQLASHHEMVWSQKGTRLTLAMAERTDRWLLVNLDGVRMSVTHCWVEEGDCLAADLDMVFVLYPDGWEPVELRHTNAVWNSYVQAAKATGLPIYDERGDTIFAHFAEYWAHQLQHQGWLTEAYKVAEAEWRNEPIGRFPGCECTHAGPCYGELWQCTACGKTVCYAEGTDNHSEVCDACWVKQYGDQEDDDVPF